ncbi:MAG: hypothetical protein R2744_06200 [Bacteroidales bacterium]
MSNGSLKGEDLTGRNQFDLDFYDATINTLNDARFTLGYGELKVLKAGDINVNSSASRIEMEELRSLKINSKRDKFYIGEISSIEGRATLQNSISKTSQNLPDSLHATGHFQSAH